MKAYLDLLQDILDNGKPCMDRTKTGTIRVFGRMMRFDLQQGFPLITTKKVHTRSIIHELLWFMRGESNIKYLNDNGVSIWDSWHDEDGSIGPGYGVQWRRWEQIHVTPCIQYEVPNQQKVEGLVSGVGTGGEYREQEPFLYNTWVEMLHRCYNPSRKHYQWYGGQGVFVDKTWHHYPNFVNDAKRLDGWWLKLDQPDEYSLDKDFYGSNKYGPDTCIWSGQDEQRINTSRNCGAIKATKPSGKSFVTMSVKYLCQDYLLDESTVYKCLRGERNQTKGWSFEYVDTARCRVRFHDQLALAIAKIRHNPNDRRIIVSAWNTARISEMALPPCHLLFQFFVQDGKLSCLMYQRSCDTFLGVPFNIASYALLVHIIAKMTNLQPGEFIWTGGDVHLYNNHLDQARLQLTREPRPLPTLSIDYRGQGINDWKFDDFVIEGYDPHPHIRAEVSV